jgi:hypothetical protein
VPVEFYWDDWEVPEDEYRRHATLKQIADVDEVDKE